MRKVIDRAAFLEHSTIPREDVPVPEFGEGVVVPVWGMSAGERTRFEQSLLGKDGKQSKALLAEIRARLVVASCRKDDSNTGSCRGGSQGKIGEWRTGGSRCGR